MWNVPGILCASYVFKLQNFYLLIILEKKVKSHLLCKSSTNQLLGSSQVQVLDLQVEYSNTLYMDPALVWR